MWAVLHLMNTYAMNLPNQTRPDQIKGTLHILNILLLSAICSLLALSWWDGCFICSFVPESTGFSSLINATSSLSMFSSTWSGCSVSPLLIVSPSIDTVTSLSSTRSVLVFLRLDLEAPLDSISWSACSSAVSTWSGLSFVTSSPLSEYMSTSPSSIRNNTIPLVWAQKRKLILPPPNSH